MRVMCPKLFLLLLLLALSQKFLQAQPISVTFEGNKFSKGPSASQVRKLVHSLLSERIARYSRCNIRLTGQSTVCDLHFAVFRPQIKTVAGTVKLREVKGRIPIGNFLVLLQGRLRWPESVLAKDIVVKMDSNRLSSWLSSVTSINNARGLGAGSSCRSSLRAPKKKAKRKDLIRKFLDVGCTLSLSGKKTVIRNASSSGLLYLVGNLPNVLGAIDVECLGNVAPLPCGDVAYDCSLVIVDGALKPQGPERFLAASEYSKGLAQLKTELDDALVCRSFVERARMTQNGTLEMSGIAVIGLFRHLDRIRQRGWAAKRFQGQTIKINIFR